MNVIFKNISKTYNRSRILDDVSLECNPGMVTTISGANGTGKTTLFNLLSGFEKPDNGSIYIDTINIYKLSPNKIADLGTGRLFQEIRLFKSLNAFNNIILGQKNYYGENPFLSFLFSKKLKRIKSTQIENIKGLIEKVGFKDDINKFPSMLSYGQCKLIAIASLLFMDPEVMLLDEPSSGLSSPNINRLVNIIFALKNQGKTIIMIEHNKSLINELSDNSLFIENGKLSTL